MNRNREQPPPTWADWGDSIVKVNDDMYYAFIDGQTRPTIWHWCEKRGYWASGGTSLHDLLSYEPLHLEPSLLYPCCDLHGWIRNGKWVSA